MPTRADAQFVHDEWDRRTRAHDIEVYRSFCAFLGPEASVAALSAETVRAYRDQLEANKRSPATIAKHLSALRILATHSTSPASSASTARESRAARHARSASDEYARLLRMPDRRTRQGKRKPVLLHLLCTAALRRAEACAVELDDVDERHRSGDRRLRKAIPHSSAWCVTVTYGKAWPPTLRAARGRSSRRGRRLGQEPSCLRARAAARLPTAHRKPAATTEHP